MTSSTSSSSSEVHSHDHHHHHHGDNHQHHDHSHSHDHVSTMSVGDHGHTHEHLDHPGYFHDRPTAASLSQQNTTSAATTNTTKINSFQHQFASHRDYDERAFTVGVGGPVGSGKTALLLALCQKLRDRFSIAAVTNDIFTREDGEFLTRHEALPPERIMAVETGGCPHAAIREDISANLAACEQLTTRWSSISGSNNNNKDETTTTATSKLDLILLESGGDNLAANFSPELADYTIYVIDVAGGDKVPRKGGPGVTQSDLLVINKTDLADAVGASLQVMERDAIRMRSGRGGGGTTTAAGQPQQHGPVVFCQARQGLGLGVDEVVEHIINALKQHTTS